MDRILALARDIARKLPGLELRFGEPMAGHTSFKIGGPAAAFAVPGSSEELAALLRLLFEAGEEPLVIGNGTNLLVTDEPLERIVVKIGDGLGDIKRVGDQTLHAGAGASLARLASFACRESLSGLEFAHGIPGSVGGAVMMNAGAYGGEIKDVVTQSTYVRYDGSSGTLKGEEHGFSYRHSAYLDMDAVITGAVFVLTPGEPQEIRARMESLAQRRRESQPLDMPSAGSTFKRPQNGYAAALIDEAGLKGFAIGGAQVSAKHAGFVVNSGGATFEDVTALMEHIQKTVFEREGITLEPEVRIIRNREN